MPITRSLAHMILQSVYSVPRLCSPPAALQIASHASLGAVTQAVRRTPFSTAVRPRQQQQDGESSYNVPNTLVGLDEPHVDDVIHSVTAIEKILDNLKHTQLRQRQLFLEQADTLIPSPNSPRMTILFEEVSLQQSQIAKNLNNIKETLREAENHGVA